MDCSGPPTKNAPHARTIIHLDMDYFYAQVEELRHPTLRTKPLGVQQKNFVVTCNYIARQHGVMKLMLVTEAKKKCPTLVLVNGEDLTPYRKMSQKIFEFLHNYTPHIEKLGLDENYMDVSELVESERKLKSNAEQSVDAMNVPQVRGHICPVDGTFNNCACGCVTRLALGTHLAQKIRGDLQAKLGITCCAGIAYNKLLAKLVGAQNKPNAQTVLVSTHAEQFMRDLKDLHRVTGIGQKTESLLLESGIANIEELQLCDMDFLRKQLGHETAMKLKDLSFGRDESLVRPTGKPKTIGLEDSCRSISLRTDVEDRFRLLLLRLMEQVADDGRIPIALKVILRKFDNQKKTSHRETKQANILPSLFRPALGTDTAGPKVMLSEGAQEKLLKIIMRLFERIVDMKKPFNITLIGLAFSKFQQRKVGSSSIANFLIKKTDLEVQSITSLSSSGVAAATSDSSPTLSLSSSNHSDDGFRSSPTTFQSSDQFSRRRTTTVSPIPMLIDNGTESAATNSDFSDFSETEVEPSPKKGRFGRLLIAKRHCIGGSSLSNAEAFDVASPSKLRVCDLRLNSRDSESDLPAGSLNGPMAGAVSTPRFRINQAPSKLLHRIDHLENLGKRIDEDVANVASSSTLPSPMDEQNSGGSIADVLTTVEEPMRTEIMRQTLESSSTASSIETTVEATTTTSNASETLAVTVAHSSNIPCPKGVDPTVFNELPVEVQNELMTSWRNSLAAAAAAVANKNANSSASVETSDQTSEGTATSNSKQKNTLYRYFLRNK